MGVTRRTLWHTGIYSAGLIASRGISFILLPIYSRVWQDQLAEMSIWDLSTTTVLFAIPVLEIGLSTALMRFYYLVDGEESRRRIFSTSLALVALFAGTGIVAGFAFSRPLAQAIFGSPEHAGLVPLIVCLTAVTVLGNQPLSLLRAQERSATYVTLTIVRVVLGPPLILLLVVYFDMGTAGVLWGDLAGLSAMALSGLWVCRKWVVPRFDPVLARKMLTFGVPLTLCGLAYVVITVSDRYILRSAFGLEAMAPYSFAFKVSIMMALVTRSMQTAWPPASFQIANEPDGPAILGRIHRLLIAAVLFAALGLTAFAPELVLILGTPALAAAVRYIPWFAFSYVSSMTTLLLSNNITIAKKTSLVAVVYVMGAAAKVVLTLVLIRVIGMEGAAQATFLAFSLEACVAYVLAQRVYPVPYERGRLAALLLAGGALGALCYVAYPLSYLVSLPVRTGALMGFVFVLFAFGIVSPKERRQISGFVRGKLARGGRQI